MRGSARYRMAVAMALLFVAAGCASSAPQALALKASTTTATSRTTVITYEPFTRSGAVAPGIDVVGKSSDADCYIGAISTPRRDAFRCATSQNLLYDPCFLDPAGPPIKIGSSMAMTGLKANRLRTQ